MGGQILLYSGVKNTLVGGLFLIGVKNTLVGGLTCIRKCKCISIFDKVFLTPIRIRPLNKVHALKKIPTYIKNAHSYIFIISRLGCIFSIK